MLVAPILPARLAYLTEGKKHIFMISPMTLKSIIAGFLGSFSSFYLIKQNPIEKILLKVTFLLIN